jgi:hypothetical protein
VEASVLMLEGGAQDSGADEQIVTVETAGKYTYVPIITHNEARQEGGENLSISKGFSVPLITKPREPAADEGGDEL